MTATRKKYQVLWHCPHCGNSHTWWWESQWEAFDEGETDMRCDRCDKITKCKGDGNGFYEPVRESTPFPGSFGEKLQDLEKKCDELLELNTDVHNYVRGLEDKVNDHVKDIYGGIYALTKRLSAIENGEIFDNLSRRMVTAELAITNLEEGVSINTYADRKKKSPEQPSFIDLIHGEKEPFYERFREGCEFNEEVMPGESIAKILRFIAVEVERMTERDMGGSFTVSNLTVGRNLRELADQAEIED